MGKSDAWHPSLEKHRVEWNAMAVVNAYNAEHPLEFYHFFRDNGCQYLQFTPIVERLTEHEDGRTLASLADVNYEDNYEDVGNAKNRKKIRKSQLPISQ